MSDEHRPQHDFWAELRRHPAFQSAVVFAGGSWLVLQAADIFGLATGTVRLLGGLLITIFVLLVGYSLAAVMRGGRNVAVTRARARTMAIVTALLLVLGTGAWFARPHLVPDVRPGAEVIAVLPFTATGAGVDVLGEGLVDLLSANLNEVGLIRTINPRTTLYEFDRAAPNGSIDLPGQLRVGRSVGAGSVLVGSLVSTGSEVRITAELYAVETGGVIAKAQESGRPDSVLALVDQLSIELMQDIWRSRSPIPELRVSAITTQSVPAIRAFLRGEQFYRRVQWDSARTAFEEAVAHDSTFALAHYRLGEVYGWSENLGSEKAREHSDKAAQFADRLPARERTLVVAHQLHEQGSVAAIDSLVSYVDRFPDDVSGRYLLADARYHADAVLGLGLDALREGFTSVHATDPTFAPNYAHLIELTSITGDTAGYRRYVDDLSELLPTEGEVYEAARVMRWGPRDEALARIGSALRAEGAIQSPALGRVMTNATLRAFGAVPDIDFVLAAIDTIEAVAGDVRQVRMQVEQSRAGVLATAGRMREAEEIVARIRTENADRAAGAAIQFIASGLAPASAFVPERELLEKGASRPAAAYWLAIEAISRSDVATVERHIATITADTARGFVRPEMLAALRGWTTAARGDTLAGIQQMKHALVDLGYGAGGQGPTTPLRIILGMLQVTQPGTRDEGFHRLSRIVTQEGGTVAFVVAPLAEAYIAAGRIEDAKVLYARFLALWKDADPELRPRVEAVEQALTRITAERGAS